MRLEEKIANLLIKHKLTLSLAESCSGGLLTHRLTNIPGSSQFLKLTIVAYSNDAKMKLLNVSPSLIKTHGAVSAEVANAMADGARHILQTDFGISITGIAGPDGATKSKPVGLTFISLSTAHKTVGLEYTFEGSRLDIKTQATTAALNLLSEFLPAF